LKKLWPVLTNIFVLLSVLGLIGVYVGFSSARVYAISPTSQAPFPAQNLTSAGSLGLYAGYPTLRRIAGCESTGDPNGIPRQFLADGSILWGNDPKTGQPIHRDMGELQINTWVWASTATKMGFDLKTEQGNVAFGKYLYDKLGAAPWYASEGCWSSRS
jgi:hypothetical protein